MAKSGLLDSALKAANPIVRKYIAKLEARNARLESEIAGLEVEKTDRNNRLKALENALKEKKIDIRYNIGLGDRLRRAREREEQKTPEEIRTEIRQLEARLGIPPAKRVA